MMHQSLASSHVVHGQQLPLLHLPTKKHQLKLVFFFKTNTRYLQNIGTVFIQKFPI
jgi:hypothetical protein